MPLKITGLVHSCDMCPNRIYESAGRYDCDLVKQVIRTVDTIPAFCPLVDFPAKAIADLESTVRAMQELNKYGVTHALLTHVATKLKTTLSDQFVLRINLKEDGSAVYLNPNFILKVEIDPWIIYFSNQPDHDYRLLPDSVPPKLQKKRFLDGSEEPIWPDVELA